MRGRSGAPVLKDSDTAWPRLQARPRCPGLHQMSSLADWEFLREQIQDKPTPGAVRIIKSENIYIYLKIFKIVRSTLNQYWVYDWWVDDTISPWPCVHVRLPRPHSPLCTRQAPQIFSPHCAPNLEPMAQGWAGQGSTFSKWQYCHKQVVTLQTPGLNCFSPLGETIRAVADVDIDSIL